MKVDVKPTPLIHPTTIVVVGTMIQNKPNYTTIGDVAVAGINPPLLMISLHQDHNAMKYINEHHQCTINIPTKDMVEQVDYAGIYSSKTTDKSTLFDASIVDGLPVITDAPITLFVKEHSRVEIDHRVILVCDITKTMISSELIQSNRIDFTTLKTVLYGLDNRYYTTGSVLGKGYDVGMKKEENNV